jgi:hypothetical protein
MHACMRAPVETTTTTPSSNTTTSPIPPHHQPLPKKAAIKAFYLLIFGAAALRSLWFFIPSDVLEPSYAPAEVWAFQTPVRACVVWWDHICTCMRPAAAAAAAAAAGVRGDYWVGVWV